MCVDGPSLMQLQLNKLVLMYDEHFFHTFLYIRYGDGILHVLKHASSIFDALKAVI
jgi:hypothetical protein